MDKIPCKPRKSCCDCIWDYEGDCNLSHITGFESEYDRYEDDESEWEFKVCNCRVEYIEWEYWFVDNRETVLEVLE